jgi:XTP/dITP diphosphohydrolase
LPQPKLLIATHNKGKMREYRHLLRDVPFELVSLGDVGIAEEVDETGTTFEENAWLKASTYARLSGLLTLSDDSGLEVDVLGGEPGVHSARYGGDSCATDQDRVALLLSNLEGTPWEKRIAQFRCVIAIAVPPGHPYTKVDAGTLTFRKIEGINMASVVGSVAGMIQYKPEGEEGFGYDPVFYLPSCQQTMAQLPLEEKSRISHRSDASGKAVEVLKRLAITTPAQDEKVQ